MRLLRFSNARYAHQGGFTLIELMVGFLIIAAAASTIFYGIAYARAELRRVMIRERALEELTGYMDFWVARINYGQLTPGDLRGDSRGEEVILFNPTVEELDEGIIGTIIRDDISVDNNEMYNPGAYPYYNLRATIYWQDHLGDDVEQSIMLETRAFELR